MTVSIEKSNYRQKSDSLFFNIPKTIPGSVSISNAIFDSDIEVEILNGIDIKSVMTLDGEQMFDRALNCGNITVGKFDLVGVINGFDLNAIYENTLMVSFPELKTFYF